MKINGNDVNAGSVAPGIENDGARALRHAHSVGDDSALMPEPMPSILMCGDAVGDLAVLMAQMSIADRSSAKKAERAADTSQAAAEKAQVEEMHLKADDIRAAGWASGIAQMASGALGVVGATACRAGGLAEKVLDGSAKGVAGTGTGISKSFEGAGADADARAAGYGQQSHAFERTSKSAHEDAADARELFKKVGEFLKEMRQAKDAAMTAAARRA